MPVLAGIIYKDQNGSATLKASQKDGTSGTRIMIIDWVDLDEFIEALIGTVERIGDTNIFAKGVAWPGKEYLRCVEATGRGIGWLDKDAEDNVKYQKATVVAKYKGVNFTLTGDDPDEDDPDAEAQTFLQESVEFGTEIISIPADTYTYLVGGESVKHNIAKFVGVEHWVLNSPEESELRAAIIRATQGKVNNATFFGFPAESVLFTGASANRKLTSSGAEAWNVTYRFAIRYVSWNRVFRTDSWVRLNIDPYESTDLGVLF